MRGGFLWFQAQYLRRICVPPPASIPLELAPTLLKAFDTQDFALATESALRAYGIEALPMPSK
mgnify:CR=1 FL=1